MCSPSLSFSLWNNRVLPWSTLPQSSVKTCGCTAVSSLSSHSCRPTLLLSLSNSLPSHFHNHFSEVPPWPPGPFLWLTSHKVNLAWLGIVIIVQMGLFDLTCYSLSSLATRCYIFLAYKRPGESAALCFPSLSVEKPSQRQWTATVIRKNHVFSLGTLKNLISGGI